jgi:hypothetical protein
MTVIVVVAWLKGEDWPRWQSLDAQLPAYDRWLKKINAGIEQAEHRGARTEKVVVDPDLFLAWSKAHGKPIDRTARAQYAAAELLRRRS